MKTMYDVFADSSRAGNLRECASLLQVVRTGTSRHLEITLHDYFSLPIHILNTMATCIQ